MYIKKIKFDSQKIANCNTYISQLGILKNISEILFKKSVTFLIGDNGTGKSTLLEAIALSLGFNPNGGSKNFTDQHNNSYSPLFNYTSLEKSFIIPKDNFYFRAETFFNLATTVDDYNSADYYGGKSLHDQSHGEGFLSIIKHRFYGNGLYLLDEPESSLSPMNQLSLLGAIDSLAKNNSQFIIATHSPILLALPQAEIYAIEEDQLVRRNYEDTEHYQVSKLFLNNYKSFLNSLLKEDN